MLESGDAASIGVGISPAGIFSDIYTAGTGEDYFTEEDVSGWMRAAVLIPGVSELRKGGRVADAVGTVHKNSLDYVGDTPVYAIRGPDASVHKIGMSAQGTRVRDGLSIRAEQQVRALYRATGDFYESQILRPFGSTRSARAYETRMIERFRRMYGEDTLPGNLTNR